MRHKFRIRPMDQNPNESQSDKLERVSLGGRKAVVSFLLVIGGAIALLVIIRFALL